MNQSNINLDMKALEKKYSKPINNRNISNVGTKAVRNMRKNAKINNGTNKRVNNTRKNNTIKNKNKNKNNKGKNNTRKNKQQAQSKTTSEQSNSNGGLSSIITILLQLLLVSLVLYFLYQIYIFYDTPCIYRKDFTQFMLDGFDSPCEFRKHAPKPNPLIGEKEVFNISDQKYTFEQAKCKCKAYGAELASYDQIVKAYNKGAEWCNYGWSKGKQAYYPSQDDCSHKDGDKKKKCGKPGINGGKFPEKMKFGANCYGIKPKGEIVRKITPKCKVEDNFCKLPKNFRSASKLDSDTISPFNPKKYHE
ncbi:MAG: hypothetical protein ACYS5V_15185, partial [Planctomycetota bacterium]|jgi:hypothetical protein